jgi:hypothetical protein
MAIETTENQTLKERAIAELADMFKSRRGFRSKSLDDVKKILERTGFSAEELGTMNLTLGPGVNQMYFITNDRKLARLELRPSIGYELIVKVDNLEGKLSSVEDKNCFELYKNYRQGYIKDENITPELVVFLQDYVNKMTPGFVKVADKTGSAISRLIKRLFSK